MRFNITRGCAKCRQSPTKLAWCQYQALRIRTTSIMSFAPAQLPQRLLARTLLNCLIGALALTRQRLFDLTRSARESGSGVSVVRMWKAGNVEYKKIPELAGVDLERWRGKGREEIRATVAK